MATFTSEYDSDPFTVEKIQRSFVIFFQSDYGHKFLLSESTSAAETKQ